MIAGAVGLNDRELGYNVRFVYPRLGIGELSRSSRARAGLELGRARADRLARGACASTRRCPTTRAESHPAASTARLLADVPGPVRGGRGCAARTSTTSTSRSPEAGSLHWVYVPEEKYPFYRVGCYSNFSAAMAPPGKACLYVELADRAPPDLDRLLPEVARGLVEMGLIDAPNVRFARRGASTTPT